MSENGLRAVPCDEGADKPLIDLPVRREHVPKGITVHANGSSTEVHYGYDVLHAGEATAAHKAEPE